MRLFGTPGSPFARKVRIVLEEKRIPHEYIVERGSAPGSRVPQFNPLGKVPTLVLDDGRGLYDSPVIVEYLDSLGIGPQLIPEPLNERIEVKRWEALGDGIKCPTASEWKNRDVARKSLVAVKAIQTGEMFTEENLACKRPGTGVSPIAYWQTLGQTARRSYNADETLDV